MLSKILKYIVSFITVLIAIGYFVYISIDGNCELYEYMILSLLILISTTFVIEIIDEERKWKEVEKNLQKDILSISECQIMTFDNTKDWVDEMYRLTKKGNHTFDSAALDSATRSKKKTQYSSIWGFLNVCSKEKRISFRHILRIRKNNFNNLLDRIIAGSAEKNSYFAYYKLPKSFSFPTFGIIDERYIVTRSPYQEGEPPCYLIIENTQISRFFIRYFEELWRSSIRVDTISVLRELYKEFENEYTKKEKKRFDNKMTKIDKEGIMDDI